MKRNIFHSITFLVAAMAFYFLNPLDQIRDLVDLSPNSLIFPLFYNVANISLAGSIIFLFCSVYAGVKSLREAPEKRTAVILLVSISSIYLVTHTLIALNLLG